MHTENYTWLLISRALSGEASADEILRLQQMLDENESLQQQYEMVRQFWNASRARRPGTGEENSRHIAAIIQKAQVTAASSYTTHIFPKRRWRNRRKKAILFIACGIILLAGGSVFLAGIKRQGKNITHSSAVKIQQRLIAAKGSRNKAVLPDGSAVWLNAGSALTYDNFNDSAREVYLKGEAFFDVVKQPGHPFIVHANGVDIKVLGTAFNVKSYAEDNRVEATLIRGLIQITRQNKKDDKPLYLHPHEKLIIDLSSENRVAAKKDKPPVISPPAAFKMYHLDSTVKTENMLETAWVYNRLEFRGDSFEELAKKLERWYNVTIVFNDDEVKQINFYGSFEEENLQQAFKALKAAAAFDYTINDNEIFIGSSKKTTSQVKQ